MHNFGACEKGTAVQCQIPILPAGETRFCMEVAIVQRSSFRKYPKSAQPYVSVSSIFYTIGTYSKFANLLGKICFRANLRICHMFLLLILGTFSKFARKNNFLAPSVCFPQPCSSAGRRFAASKTTFTKLPTNLFVSTTTKSMKYVVNWIPLRMRGRWRNTQAHLNDC